MKQLLIYSACLIALTTIFMHAHVVPYISIRSQSENAARELVLWQTQINLDDMIKTYGSVSLTAEYEQTFASKKLARALFNDALTTNDTCMSFKVQGSMVPQRDARALLAENFGLPTDYSSVVTINPSIKNLLIAFNFYVGLDEWAPGWYFRIHMPVVHTMWSLHYGEKDIKHGSNNYPLGYFNGINSATAGNPYGVSRTNLVDTFEAYISRREIPTIDGIIFDRLEKARFSECTLDATKVSEIQAAVGWNFCTDECYHVGINGRISFPTGSRPLGTYLFEPIVGNGQHWELGGGFTAHWQPWTSCDECDNFAIYFDANIMHLFNASQIRTFDFCDKPLSRYMLAARMDAPATNLYDSADANTHMLPTYQFANEFTSVANLSTIPVDVSVAVKADLALKFAYTHRNFQFDLGYNLWARSCEKICPRCGCVNPDTTWALKGDAFVYGFTFTPENDIAEAVPLSASELDATVFCGTNNAQRTVALYWEQNPGVDNATAAFDEDGNALSNFENTGSTIVPMYSSFNPYIFSTNEYKQWDIKAAQTRGISNKIFGNIGYISPCNEHWTPYIGVGFETEFGRMDKKFCSAQPSTCATKSPGDTTTALTSCCTNCCGNSGSSNRCESNKGCIDCAISQWGIWIKGGISFK